MPSSSVHLGFREMCRERRREETRGDERGGGVRVNVRICASGATKPPPPDPKTNPTTPPRRMERKCTGQRHATPHNETDLPSPAENPVSALLPVRQRHPGRGGGAPPLLDGRVGRYALALDGSVELSHELYVVPGILGVGSGGEAYFVDPLLSLICVQGGSMGVGAWVWVRG